MSLVYDPHCKTLRGKYEVDHELCAKRVCIACHDDASSYFYDFH